MSARPTVIGVDPGQTTGIALLTPGGEPEFVQCSPGPVYSIAWSLVAGGLAAGPVLLAVEEFVVGPRAGRSSSAGAGRVTRDLLGALVELSREAGAGLVRYRAADVKPWATDRRLAAAGLVEPTKGMRHARDGGRVALYAAVRDGGHPDPLSTRATGSPAAGAARDRSPNRKGPRS